MDKLSDLKPGDVLGQVDLGSYIAAMGKGVAEAQRALDDNTIGLLGAFTKKLDGLDGKSLIQLGLSPAFYHFRSATISASVTMSIQVRQEIDVKVHVEAGKGSSSSSTTASKTHDISSTNSTVVISESQSAQASTDASLTAMEQIDSYSWANSESQSHFVLAERESVTASSDLQAQGLVRFSSQAGVYVVPPRDRRWAVIRLVASAGGESYQLRPQGSPPYTPGSGTAQDIASGIKQYLQSQSSSSVVLRLGGTAPDDLSRVLFKTGSHVVRTEGSVNYAARLRALAHIINAAKITSVKLVGRADGVGPFGYNLRLSQLRGEAVRDALKANQANCTFTIQGRGEIDATDDKNDANQRRVDIQALSGSDIYLYIEDDPSELNANMTIAASGTNGIVVADQYAGTGKGFAAGQIVTSAADLATDIRNNTAFHASAVGELVYLTKKSGGTATVAKVKSYATSQSSQSSSSESSLDGESSSAASSEADKFTKTEVNRAAAIAGSLDVRFARMFDVSMSGNMSIAAELVSVPAPAEFLQYIKDALGD